MRSVYVRILLWCLGTLVLSMIAFVAISRAVSSRYMGRHGPFGRLSMYQLNEARTAFETGGTAALSAALQKLDRAFQAEHHLTDARGTDLVDGRDRSALLRGASQRRGPREVDGRVAFVTTSGDGRYSLVVFASVPFQWWTFLPYYVPLLLLVAVLCWILAFSIASPLRKLARVVDQFGRGDLSARAHTSRRDEIGDLARAFDKMAERTETLLTAERRLLQDISHELRSPLARLTFAAELARAAPDREAAVARLKKEIARLTNLVSALLEMTRAEGDPASRSSERFVLNDIVREVIEDCGMEAVSRDCRIKLNDGGTAVVDGDRELLRRAIENILRNAMRYAPNNSAVDAAIRVSDSAAVFSVRDYGPGVPAELLPRIFTPFFRVDESRDGSTGGVGLGLAIAQRALTLHNGSINARNADPGLEVSITLPLANGVAKPA